VRRWECVSRHPLRHPGAGCSYDAGPTEKNGPPATLKATGREPVYRMTAVRVFTPGARTGDRPRRFIQCRTDCKVGERGYQESIAKRQKKPGFSRRTPALAGL